MKMDRRYATKEIDITTLWDFLAIREGVERPSAIRGWVRFGAKGISRGNSSSFCKACTVVLD